VLQTSIDHIPRNFLQHSRRGTTKSMSIYRLIAIGVDLAGILRGRMAGAKGGSVPNGVGCGEGCPLSSRLEGLGSVVSTVSSHRGVRGRALAENGF